jgi:general secretion pathway protein D
VGELDDEGAGLIKRSNLVFTTINTTGYELFRFLETIGKTRLVSNPRIMVTERQEATIHVGTREAYVTTTTTSGQSSSTTAESVEFIDVGIKLLVTPTIINDEGFVTMKIKPEVSSVTSKLTTKAGSEIPIVDTSTAETNVVVKDGATVIIGGLRKNQEATVDSQVPLIARLPLIGELFRQKNNADTVAELVVFITPHIMTGEELVTGDEEQFGGGVKSYRMYAPLLDHHARTAESFPLAHGTPDPTAP